MRDYQEILAEILIDGPALQRRVRELADEVNRDYAGEELMLI
jgi:hypoxanthine-guanine phosphoribosyltransferase